MSKKVYRMVGTKYLRASSVYYNSGIGDSGWEDLVTYLHRNMPKMRGYLNTIASDGDLNNITTYGTYRYIGTSTEGLSNCPADCEASFTLFCSQYGNSANSTANVRQTIHRRTATWVRYTLDSGETWSTWRTIVQQDEGEVIGKYRIGDIICTSTKTDPSSSLGGTWTLVDKEFKQQVLNAANNSAITKTNLTSYSGYVYLTDHIINLKISLVPSADLSDTAVTLGTLVPAKCGVEHFSCTHYWIGFGDGANGAAMFSMTYLGVIQCLDLIDLTSFSADGDSFRMDFTMSIPYTAILDDFCDKFYWKRTA